MNRTYSVRVISSSFIKAAVWVARRFGAALGILCHKHCRAYSPEESHARQIARSPLFNLNNHHRIIRDPRVARRVRVTATPPRGARDFGFGCVARSRRRPTGHNLNHSTQAGHGLLHPIRPKCACPARYAYAESAAVAQNARATAPDAGKFLAAQRALGEWRLRHGIPSGRGIRVEGRAPG